MDSIERPGALRVAWMEAARLDVPKAASFGIKDWADGGRRDTREIAKLLCIACGHVGVLVGLARGSR